MSNERAFLGIWIPAEIWLDKRLNALDKIIFSEIASLSTDKGCFASNEYLAEFCGCTERNIQTSLAKLKSIGLVYQASFDGRTRWLKVNNFCIADMKNSSPLTGNILHPSDKERESSKEKETINSINNNNKVYTVGRFAPPSVREVEDYISTKGYTFDSEEFVAYYDSQGWKKANGQRLTNWKSACVTWERKEKDRQKNRRKTKEEIEEEKSKAMIQRMIELGCKFDPETEDDEL